MSLISTTELRDLQDRDAPLVVADVRFYLADHDQGRREYDLAHLPNSVFVDLHSDLADTSIPSAGRHPLPPTTAFGALLDRLGIGPDTTVVAYDDHGGAMASRMWWMLRSVGHADAYVLDGGFSAWIEAGFPVTADRVRPSTAAPQHAPDEKGDDKQGNDGTGSARYPVPDHWTGVADAAEIGDEPDRPFSLIDSRAPERYRGDFEPLDPRAGHIPGAINRFHGDVVGSDRRLLSASELAERFANLGPAPVVYCGSGVTACHNLLAMVEAGITDARLYPGSWSEWSADPDRPLELGDPGR